ncbi:MAG: proliferating cell nuclear antigen (pcna) [Candidatus Woesearchaeota archaeon]|jgi:proliferating cell nuclear antigen|nr:proliferating cell nuclear antigen (pcna) [Candidatus Woesearchaeota archaeon]MDP7323137.1 proliferating cell nuclear antigen (pcna) [Candidatus Woesearchaeota archaeon]MDP7458080.1 proliferating cell nuclear antigen (pcna) [Candidatus Woesearchaeota archaeon]
MKLALAEPKYLKESINIISELVNEARFSVTKDAIELVAMDPANVAMVIFKLLSSSFIEYDVKEPVELSINLSNLKQILRRAGPNDILSIELNEDNKLQIQLKGTSTRTFFLPIIDIDEKEHKVPELSFAVKVKAPCSVVSDAVEDVDIVSESVTFIAEKGKLTIAAEGDLSKAKIEIKESNDISLEVGTNDIIKSKYSIEYLKKMIGGSKLSEEVTLEFNKDYPLKLEFMVIDKVQLSFILAPRVESD